jgi:hypothetical protein
MLGTKFVERPEKFNPNSLTIEVWLPGMGSKHNLTAF